MCTYAATARQTAWFDVDRDASHGAPASRPVEIGVRLGHLSEIEKAIYLAGNDLHDDLIYTASFATDPAVPRRSVSSWAVGDALVDDPEPALRRRIAHVYLPPLRDAVRDLDGGDQAHLYEVLRIIIGSEVPTTPDFVEAANDALKVVAKHPVAVKTQDTIQTFFTQATPPNREHVIELNERVLELRRLARLLRIQLAESHVPVGDIAATGLGYANLLYIAMIVLQLVKATESDLTLLLVEEPEAHLHPQLQLVLLDFLQRQAAATGKVVGRSQTRRASSGRQGSGHRDHTLASSGEHRVGQQGRGRRARRSRRELVHANDRVGITVSRIQTDARSIAI